MNPAQFKQAENLLLSLLIYDQPELFLEAIETLPEDTVYQAAIKSTLKDSFELVKQSGVFKKDSPCDTPIQGDASESVAA